jgi:hypothetical protein
VLICGVPIRADRLDVGVAILLPVAEGAVLRRLVGVLARAACLRAWYILEQGTCTTGTHQRADDFLGAAAVCEHVLKHLADLGGGAQEETATKLAPWYLIPANNKPFSRIAAFRILVDRLGSGVSLEPRSISPELFKQAKRILGLSASASGAPTKAANRKIRKHGADIEPPV